MNGPLFIIGCGGFGREVHQIIAALREAQGGWDVSDFIDDAPSPENLARVAELGSIHVGGVSVLADRTEPFRAVIAIGDPAGRRAVAERLSAAPAEFPVVVHPDSTIGPDVTLEQGCVVAAGARLSTNIRAGVHVHIDQNVTVGHDSVLGDFSRLNPQACISGSVVVGSGATVGASATILPDLEIGEDAVIGAAACVVRSVRAKTTVKGVPAR